MMASICADETVMGCMRALRNACILNTFCLLDHGTFAYIVEARCPRTRTLVTLKIMKTREAINRIPHSTLRELRALTCLHHPNILRLQCAYAVGTAAVVLQTARYDCSLAQYRREVPRLSSAACKYVFTEICKGVAAAHAMGIMHRDLKPGNILLRTSVAEVVVADWGLARGLEDTSPSMLTGEVVTTWYAPPEVLCKRTYSFPADVWSLGIMLLELAQWKHVFRRTERATFMTDVSAMHAALGATLAAAGASSEAADLIGRMLALEPAARITMADVLLHPYCTGAASPGALPIHRSLSSGLVIPHRTEVAQRLLQLRPPDVLPPFRLGWPPAVSSANKVTLLELASKRFGRHWLAPYVLAMDLAWISGCDVSPSRMYACFTLAAACMLPQDELAYRDHRCSPYYGGAAINNAYDLADLELEILQLLHGRVPWPRPEVGCILALAPEHHHTAAYLASYPEVMGARGWQLTHVASACACGDIDNEVLRWIELLVLL